MNKYQEALIDIRCDTHNFIENNYDEAFKMVYNKQFKLLQELVDKETPKKPLVNKYKNSEHYFCPNCKSHRFGIIDYGEYKNEWRKGSELTTYCPRCGQKLDWSDEDENN